MKRGQAGAAMHTSIPEQVIYRFMKKAYRNTVSSYSPEWLRLYHGSRKSEIDVYVPDLDLAIEYNGSRWHRGRELHDSEKEDVIRQNVKTLIVIKEPGLETKYDLADVFYINIPRHPACKYLNEVIKEISEIIQKQYSIKMDFKVNLSDELPKIRALLKQNQQERMLASASPETAAEWNYERNGDLSPDNIYAKSEKLVWWTCPAGHTYQEKVISGGNCSVCRFHHYIKERKYEFQNEKCAKCGVCCEVDEMYGNVELPIERAYRCKMNTPPGYRLLCKECYQKRKKKIAVAPLE